MFLNCYSGSKTSKLATKHMKQANSVTNTDGVRLFIFYRNPVFLKLDQQ